MCIRDSFWRVGRWLAMAWAMLPGLMSLTRIECLRWDGNGDRTGGSCFGGRRRDPSERRAPPTTCCCQSLGSQISALTISSRGSGWPASWCRRVPPRIRALQMTAGGQPAPPACRNLHGGALPRINGPVLRLAQLNCLTLRLSLIHISRPSPQHRSVHHRRRHRSRPRRQRHPHGSGTGRRKRCRAARPG